MRRQRQELFPEWDSTCFRYITVYSRILLFFLNSTFISDIYWLRFLLPRFCLKESNPTTMKRAALESICYYNWYYKRICSFISIPANHFLFPFCLILLNQIFTHSPKFSGREAPDRRNRGRKAR